MRLLSRSEPPSPSAAAPSLDREILGLSRSRFIARARALVYARLGLMAIGLGVLMVPAWRQAFSIPIPQAAYWYLAILAHHVASHLVVGRRLDRPVLFVTLCLDVLTVLYLVIATGGLKSPLMPTQLVLTVLFALLYPSPLALVPPLLTLPVLAKVDQILGLQTLPGDLLLLLLYTALNVTLVYIIVYLDSRERAALTELMRVSRERRRAELAGQRLRIARELHDGVGAAISGVVLQAEYLAAQVDEESLQREVADLGGAARDGMEELRRAVSMLHREFELSAAVPEYVAQLAERHRVAIECQVTGDEGELEPDRQLVIFRVLQETLANALRHAEAGHVLVTLAFARDSVELNVNDDGVGFDPEQRIEGHYGLRSIRERVARTGGEVSVTSARGQGTEISVVIPRGGEVGSASDGFTSSAGPS